MSQPEPIVVSMETSNDKSSPTSDSMPIDPIVKNTIKSRVKNPLGGKNPQLSVKGKKVSKPAKVVKRKDKSITIADTPTVSSKKSFGSKIESIDKENIPSTSKSNESNGVSQA